MIRPLATDPQTQEGFNEEFRYKEVKSVTFIKAVKTKSDWSIKTVLLSLFPIFAWLPAYNCKADFVSDLLSGFTVAVMHLPQGMAYATLAHVNPIVGIYMAVFPTLPYVVMGTSKHISLGSFSITCVMAARPIMEYSTLVRDNVTDGIFDVSEDDFGFSPIEVASMLCVSVGTFQVLLGIIKAGHLSVFLSKPIISGFTTGAAVLVLVTQLPHVLGVKPKQHFGILSAAYEVYELTGRLAETNLVALAISLLVVLCLLVCTDCVEPWLNWKYKLPGELFVVICGTLVSFLFDLKNNYNINVVGKIPDGIPGPKIPQFRLIMDPHFLFHSFAIAAVCFAVSISMATTFATKEHYSIDSNQELYAYGVGNIFGGFFPCLPMAASLTRSVIQYSTGGQTQLVTVFSSVCLILIMVLIKCLDPLPYCVLGGLVIKSLKTTLLQVTDLPTIWRQSSLDGVIWVVIFISVIVLDLVYGLVIALVIAFLSIILMNQKTYVCLLGRVPEKDLYLEMHRYLTAEPIPGIMIVQIYAGLHFANVNVCLNRIEYLFRKTSKEGPVKVVILVFSAVTFIDPEAIRYLTFLIDKFNSKGVKVCLAECTGRVYEQMQRCDFFNTFPVNCLFPSTENAVAYHQGEMATNDDQV
ncbi:solute carrier family 26 member 6-like [Macrosteles quadrilineatus]|uniref:solute carrier family 26 member 6-like n=1 Tax=Macrosteles quadrilineatus TaxID=74068 RepID=UPI0023E2678B|nr:solute carrier family 26 member 6-like [Macrosteles quadrilineatus]